MSSPVFAYALMLKEGPIESSPGNSSPGRPIAKISMDGVSKVPWALAETLKMPEAPPVRPPVKACWNVGQDLRVFAWRVNILAYRFSGGL